MRDLTIAEALAKRDHLIALEQTDIWLYREAEAEFPYDKVTRVEAGSTHRLSGPSSAALFAEIDGLTFRISIDFEGRDANGKGVSLFDRSRLRDVMRRLPAAGRAQFAKMLEDEVMPGMKRRTAEIRDALNEQQDSEDCVYGLIAFAEETA